MRKSLTAVLLMILLSGCSLLDGGNDGPRTIVFSAVDEDQYQIFSMREDGSGVNPLTSGEEGAVHPAWSPDGTRILYSSSGGVRSALWVMDSDGENKKRLVHPQTGEPLRGSRPDWSPDGKKVVFEHCFNCLFGAEFGILVADLETGGLDTLEIPQQYSYVPAWSPDGNHIAYLAYPEGDMFMISVDDGEVTRLTDAGASRSFVWLGEDRFIYYAYNTIYRSNTVTFDTEKLELPLTGNRVLRRPVAALQNPVRILLEVSGSNPEVDPSLYIYNEMHNSVREIISRTSFNGMDWRPERAEE